MRKSPIKYKPVRDHSKTRCVHCGKWMELYREKTCPKCGRVSVERANKKFCDDCHAILESGNPVCPFCGSKQRTIVELRSLELKNLTAFAHLLHEGKPSMTIKECREVCRGITQDNPYRLFFKRKVNQIQPFIQAWNALGGTAACCLSRETSRRPIVLLHSYNAQHKMEHARLLYEVIQKSGRSMITETELMRMLYRVNKKEQPTSIRFTSDFNRIEAWVAAWRRLGGTAVRSQEHM